MHNLRSKIQGLLEFDDSEEEEGEEDSNIPANMEEALAIDARGEIDDPDASEDQSIQQKRTSKMFEGMLQFSDDKDEDEDKFQLRTCGFTSSIEETVNADETDVVTGAGDEGIIWRTRR